MLVSEMVMQQSNERQVPLPQWLRLSQRPSRPVLGLRWWFLAFPGGPQVAELIGLHGAVPCGLAVVRCQHRALGLLRGPLYRLHHVHGADRQLEQTLHGSHDWALLRGDLHRQ